MAEVRDVRRLGAYDLISARDLAGPADPRPGQFYMLAAGDRWGGGSGERPYLPRAFSFARVRPGAGGGADLQFLLEDVGPGTRRLAELAPGEALMLLGPLGAGFAPPARRVDARCWWAEASVRRRFSPCTTSTPAHPWCSASARLRTPRRSISSAKWPP